MLKPNKRNKIQHNKSWIIRSRCLLRNENKIPLNTPLAFQTFLLTLTLNNQNIVPCCSGPHHVFAWPDTSHTLYFYIFYILYEQPFVPLQGLLGPCSETKVCTYLKINILNMCRTGDKLEHRLLLLLVTDLSRHYFVEIVNTAQIVHMWGQCLNIFSEVKNY